MPNVPDYSSYVGVKKAIVAQTGSSAEARNKGRAPYAYAGVFPLYKGIALPRNALISNKFLYFPACVPTTLETRTWTYGNTTAGGGAGVFTYCMAISGDGSVIVSGTNSGVYMDRSRGVAGYSFVTGPAVVDYTFASVSIDGNTIVVTPNAPNNGFWISKNGGTSWSNAALASGTSGQSGYVSGNGKVILGGSSASLFVSRDAGVTFTSYAISGGLKYFASSCDGQTIYAFPRGNYLSVSRDMGYTWTTYNGSGTNPAPVGGTTLGVYGLSCSIDGKYVGLAVYNGDLYISDNYGFTWRTVQIGGTTWPWKSIAFSSGGRYVTASRDNDTNQAAVYVSQDYGFTWAIVSTTMASQLGITQDGSRIYGGSALGGGSTVKWVQGS